jgi:hypothetical protein
MPSTSSNHVAVTFRLGGLSVTLPPSTFEFTLPGAILGPHGNREVAQLKDGNSDWELLRGAQKNQSFTMEIWADGTLYAAAVANFWAMLRRTGLYAASAYIDAGGEVFTVRMDVALTRNGVTRTWIFPSLSYVCDLTVSPSGNKTPVAFTVSGPTDPSEV